MRVAWSNIGECCKIKKGINISSFLWCVTRCVFFLVVFLNMFGILVGVYCTSRKNSMFPLNIFKRKSLEVGKGSSINTSDNLDPKRNFILFAISSQKFQAKIITASFPFPLYL